METNSSGKLKGRKQGEISCPKGKKQKIEIEHEPKGTKRKLNQDLIDHLPGFGPKARCSVQPRVEVEKLDDKCKHIGDVWTSIRGYELFIFHYH